MEDYHFTNACLDIIWVSFKVKILAQELSTILPFIVFYRMLMASLKKEINYTKQQRLDNIKNDIVREFEDFDFSTLSKRAKVSNLNNLTYASGGKPIINYIVTTFRSGSDFLTDLLYSFPGTFVHHEPLIAYDVVRLRDELSRKAAYHDVLDFFHCNYSNMDQFFNMVHSGKNVHAISFNKRFWYNLKNETYYTKKFLSEICKLFPIQLMKTTRIILKGIRSLLENQSLNLKILFLIRDPRGLLSSRWRMNR